MRIYPFDSYREYLKKHIASLPKKGRGEISRMAEALQIAQPLMSQILAGHKDLNLEQADLLSDYLKLTINEKSYLFILVQIEKSGRANLKKHFIAERERLKKESLNLQTIISPNRQLSDVEKSIFYSSWLYQAVRLLTSIEGDQFNSVEKISEKLGYDRQQISEVMNFLIQTGLCKIEKDSYQMGASNTHLERASPHLARHHTNWRLKAIQKVDHVENDELFFTAPMTLSRKDFSKIREEILGLIKSVYATVKDSSAEEFVCLNIDYFKVE